MLCARCDGEKVTYSSRCGHGGICDCHEHAESCETCGGTGKHPAGSALENLRRELKAALAAIECGPDVTEDEAEELLGVVGDVVAELERKAS